MLESARKVKQSQTETTTPTSHNWTDLQTRTSQFEQDNSSRNQLKQVDARILGLVVVPMGRFRMT